MLSFPFYAQMVVQIVTCRKLHYAMSHLVLFYSKSTRNHLPPIFLSALSPAAYVASVIDCWMKLDMFRRGVGGGEKKDKHSGSCTACMPFARRGARWDISSAGLFFKRACTALPAKGSTVGQLAIELQPPLCGGVGQIRPHNCLRSQTGTAASLRPLKPATDCCSFGGAICGDLSDTVIVEQFYLCHCWGMERCAVNEWYLDWINMSSLLYVIQLPF